MAPTFPPISPGSLERFLGLLGLTRKEPGIDSLHEIVHAHTRRIPFENISKLYYLKRNGLRGLPGLELYLDGIEMSHFGGTCYANNYYLYLLLANLGYEAVLCGADMSNPDVHVVCITSVDGRQYLIDTGYAAPFGEPLSRDHTEDLIIESGGDNYVLKPRDPDGNSRMELHRNGDLKHEYLAKPRPRKISEFDDAIAGSYREDATFMNSILLTRFIDDRFVVIHNLTVIESTGVDSKKHAVADLDELAGEISARFGIDPEITLEAVEGLVELGDAWR